ncbi:MAG: phenylalanine--tRNA ligase subunit beta [Actinomycetota bacterium]
MKVPVSWLADFVDVPADIDELEEMLTSAGLKVESIESPGLGLEDIVVAKILAIHPHPRADRVRIVEVATGSGQRSIVCGAWNFEVGDNVPLAAPGVQLPNGLKIAERNVRGTMSEGMLCSASELGLSEEAEGLLILPATAVVGAQISQALGLDDVVLDLEITPNRPDLMSLIGVAREVAALRSVDLKIPDIQIKQGDAKTVDLAAVEVVDQVGCPRYLARVITGVTIGPSPLWVQKRLTAAGLRPISNVVDATNYALLVTGHPLHAFDLDRLAGSRIVVRRATAQEPITTLDGVERKLDADDLVIADAEKPIAIAGVMGGADSEVSDATTAVLLEAAHFETTTISRTGRRHGLRSEASARYERGTDPNNVEFASMLAASLIVEWAGGEIASVPIDVYPAPMHSCTVVLRTERARLVTGADYSDAEMLDALTRLGLSPRAADGDGEITVEAPTRRQDLKIEEDLIEEVARLLGYDRVPTQLPSSRSRAAALTQKQRSIRRIRGVLAGSGMFEALTQSMIGPEHLRILGATEVSVLELAHPMTIEESLMRPSLIPALLSAVQRNHAKRNLDVRLFEIGPVFIPTRDALPQEPTRLGLVMCGIQPQGWLSKERPLDFYDLKGVVENLVTSLCLPDIKFEPVTLPPYHATRAAQVMSGTTVVGTFGELTEEVRERADLAHRIYAGEFDVDAMVELSERPSPSSTVTRFPAVLLDLALAVKDEVAAADLLSVAREAGGQDLEQVRIFDVYRGDQVGEGRKSIALSLTFRNAARTLTEQEAISARDAIAAALRKGFGAEAR